MKKIFSALIFVLLLCSLCLSGALSVSARTQLLEGKTFYASISNNPLKDKNQKKDKPDTDGKALPRPPHGKNKGKRPPRFRHATPNPVINSVEAKAAYLLDYGSGKPIFEQNQDARFPVASMCKIMSLILIYENMEEGKFSEQDTICVSETASGMGGSQVFLEAGASYKVSDLIKSIVVASANDSTVALAEHIAGSEESFVVLMNKRAKDMNLADTNFSNCTGLPRPGQYSSAKDCAIMLCELIKHKNYFNYSRIWMDKIVHSGGRVTEISNTNKLSRFFKGCDGGKTGYTSEAKHCIAATAERDGMRLISVIIGAESSKNRFAEASKLLNFGFANYTSKFIVSSNKPLEIELAVKGGREKTLPLIAAESYSVLVRKFESTDYSLEYHLPDKISAPVKKGDCIGSLAIITDNQIVKEIDVLAASDICKITYGDVLEDIIQNW